MGYSQHFRCSPHVRTYSGSISCASSVTIVTILWTSTSGTQLSCIFFTVYSALPLKGQQGCFPLIQMFVAETTHVFNHISPAPAALCTVLLTALYRVPCASYLCSRGPHRTPRRGRTARSHGRQRRSN